MLEVHEVAEIQSLLDQGEPYRVISMITGRARDTVGRVARGEPVGRRPKTQEIVYPDKRMPPVRCPRHGLVYPPCLACQIEAISNRPKGGYP